MATRILAALAALTLATPAMAQNWTQNQVGSYTYYNGSNGWSGTSNQVGSYRYYNFHGPNGQSTNCTQNQVGSYTYTNCN
jgi:hypothetical protein